MFSVRYIEDYDPFPELECASDEGLLAVGGDLTVDRLLDAYQSGIFPWYEEGLPVMWWSPDPRCVLDVHSYHVPRRLARTHRQNKFETRINTSFGAVMKACSVREEGTWITRAMLDAYGKLHREGVAHSVETWLDGKLVGGIYGIAIGGFFAGESMFFQVRDASKIAFLTLVERIAESGFSLFDLQIKNEHTAQFGAYDISRAAYLDRLKIALQQDCQFDS